MAQKGVVFKTTLSSSQCAELFKQGWQSTRGVMGRVTEAVDAVSGQGLRDFYTPTDDAFSSFERRPDHAIGVQVLSLAGGIRAGGTPIHMYIFEEGAAREVQLVSKYTITGGIGAARVVRKFLSPFQVADPGLKIVDGNV